MGRAGSTRSERWEKGTRRRQMDVGVEGRILMVKTEVATPPKQVRTENSIFALFGESIN